VAQPFLAVLLGFSYSLSVIPTEVADFSCVRAARTSATQRRDRGNTSTHAQPLRSSRPFGVRPALSLAEGCLCHRFHVLSFAAKLADALNSIPSRCHP